jgi:hypothetical protein
MDHLSGGIPEGLNAKAPLILVKGLALEILSARTMPSAQFLLNRPRSWAGRLPRHARLNKIASVNVRYAHLRITIRHQRVARSTPPPHFINGSHLCGWYAETPAALSPVESKRFFQGSASHEECKSKALVTWQFGAVSLGSLLLLLFLRKSVLRRKR